MIQFSSQSFSPTKKKNLLKLNIFLLLLLVRHLVVFWNFFFTFPNHKKYDEKLFLRVNLT